MSITKTRARDVAALFLGAIALFAASGTARAQGCQPSLVAAEFADLETAMTIAYIDTNWFHTIENLDDLPGGNPSNSFDDIGEQGGVTPVLSPATGRFRPTRAWLLNPSSSAQWQGPYMTYQPSRIDEFSSYDRGTLMDLTGTGQPYQLYSPLGLVDPSTESITQADYGDAFDRWAFVSAGCDGVFQTGDDVIRQFGSSPIVTVISSVRSAATRSAEELQPGSSIIVKGYNFGATQSTSRLLLDGAPLESISFWSGTQIELTLPEDASGTELSIEIGGSLKDTVAVQFATTAVGEWTLYE